MLKNPVLGFKSVWFSLIEVCASSCVEETSLGFRVWV
jgi:hypothetical protein